MSDEPQNLRTGTWRSEKAPKWVTLTGEDGEFYVNAEQIQQVRPYPPGFGDLLTQVLVGGNHFGAYEDVPTVLKLIDEAF